MAMLCGPLSSTLSILRSSLNFLHSPLHISLPSAHPALPRSNNPYVVVIALDFTKAFDTVLHETLLHKLAQLNIPPLNLVVLPRYFYLSLLVIAGVLGFTWVAMSAPGDSSGTASRKDLF